MLTLPYAGATTVEDGAGRIVAECPDAATARALVDMSIEVAQLRAILRLIDERVPRADDTCDEPGITISEAARRELRAARHKAFREASNA